MITRCPAAFAKAEKKCFAVRNTHVRFRCYRPVHASTNRSIRFFHSHERTVVRYSKLRCEHGLHGACSSISMAVGYCSLQQRSQKRPVSTGAVGEPNCCIITRANIDESRRNARRILKRDRDKELMVAFMLRTMPHLRKVLRYEVT